MFPYIIESTLAAERSLMLFGIGHLSEAEELHLMRCPEDNRKYFCL
jgi:hypothetical protein